MKLIYSESLFLGNMSLMHAEKVVLKNSAKAMLIRPSFSLIKELNQFPLLVKTRNETDVFTKPTIILPAIIEWLEALFDKSMELQLHT